MTDWLRGLLDHGAGLFNMDRGLMDKRLQSLRDIEEHPPQPRPFGWGYAALGTQSPAEEASVAPNVLDVIAAAQTKRLANVLMLPGRVLQSETPLTTDQEVEAALDLAGLAMTGSFGAPPGARGAGFVRRPPGSRPDNGAGLTPWSMDAGRLQQAKDMGFVTDMPLFHGTSAPEFRSFDRSKGGAVTGASSAREAIWTSRDPETAEWFAELGARTKGGAPRIVPLLHRSDKRGVINLKGTETTDEIAATLAHAWDKGFTSVLFNDYETPNGLKSIVAIKDPNQLRSPWAKFDPKKIKSSDLLAGVGGAAVGIPALLGSDDERTHIGGGSP